MSGCYRHETKCGHCSYCLAEARHFEGTPPSSDGANYNEAVEAIVERVGREGDFAWTCRERLRVELRALGVGSPSSDGLVERVAQAILDQHYYQGEDAPTGHLAQQHPADIERAERQATAAIEAAGVTALSREVAVLRDRQRFYRDAVDFAVEHCSLEEMVAFLDDLRVDLLDRWPRFKRYQETQARKALPSPRNQTPEE